MVSFVYGFNHSARPNRDWNVTIRPSCGNPNRDRTRFAVVWQC